MGALGSRGSCWALGPRGNCCALGPRGSCLGKLLGSRARGLSGPGEAAGLSGPGEAAWGSCWALGPQGSCLGKLLGSQSLGKGTCARVRPPARALPRGDFPALGDCLACSPRDTRAWGNCPSGRPGPRASGPYLRPRESGIVGPRVVVCTELILHVKQDASPLAPRPITPANICMATSIPMVTCAWLCSRCQLSMSRFPT